MAEIIGKGERPVIQSLKEILALEEEPVKAYPRSGIFTQFPITKLLPIQELVTMSEKYKKGKLDILVKKTTDSEPVAVRVNFVDHDNLTGKRFKRIKGTKDEMQRKMLERSNVGVMDLDWFEELNQKAATPIVRELGSYTVISDTLVAGPQRNTRALRRSCYFIL